MFNLSYLLYVWPEYKRHAVFFSLCVVVLFIIFMVSSVLFAFFNEYINYHLLINIWCQTLRKLAFFDSLTKCQNVKIFMRCNY